MSTKIIRRENRRQRSVARKHQTEHKCALHLQAAYPDEPHAWLSKKRADTVVSEQKKYDRQVEYDIEESRWCTTESLWGFH